MQSLYSSFVLQYSCIIGDSRIVCAEFLNLCGFEAPEIVVWPPFDPRFVCCMLSLVFFIVFLYSFSGNAGTFPSSYFATNFLNSSAIQMRIIIRHIHACMSHNLTNSKRRHIRLIQFGDERMSKFMGICTVKMRFPIFFFG